MANFPPATRPGLVEDAAAIMKIRHLSYGSNALVALTLLLTGAFLACAAGLQQRGSTIYQLDSDGTARLNEPAFRVDGNRVVQTGKDGTTMLNRPSYLVQGDGVTPLATDGTPDLRGKAKEKARGTGGLR